MKNNKMVSMKMLYMLFANWVTIWYFIIRFQITIWYLYLKGVFDVDDNIVDDPIVLSSIHSITAATLNDGRNVTKILREILQQKSCWNGHHICYILSLTYNIQICEVDLLIIEDGSINMHNLCNKKTQCIVTKSF